jgi:ribosomal subunit interface protein
MQITVSGKGVDVGESLRTHIESHAEEVITKYLDRVTSVHVVISRESHLFRIDINGNLGTHAGMVVKSKAEAEDVYACFDSALGKIEKQLRRYKRRITNHHKRGDNVQELQQPVKARKVVFERHDEAPEKDELPGAVIAEKTTHIQTMTVGEAVMRMDLEDLPALMFFNSAHGRINVVYRRADGNISWVDPESIRAA